MKTIVLGESGYVGRVATVAAHEEDVRIILRGWRKKMLSPYVYDMLKDALQVQPPTEFTKTTPWGWVMRSYWLVLLNTLHQMALKSGKPIKVIYGDELVIEFGTVIPVAR